MDLDSHLDEMREGAPGQLDTAGAEDVSFSDDPLEGDEAAQQELYSLYMKCCSEERYPRLVEVKDVKQAEYYWGGRQYVWWSSQDKTWQLPSQAQAVNYGDLDLDDMPRFEFVTNIYQARGLTVVGAISGAVPRIRFFPEDADNEDDLETAEGRTKESRLIQRWNPPQLMLQEEAYHAYTGGVVVFWVRYVGDEDDTGSDSLALLAEGSEEPEETIQCHKCGWSAPANQASPPVPCPQCGTELTEENIVEEEPISMPEDDGEQSTTKGRIVIAVYGALNFKRPQHVQKQSQFHYAAIEEEVHYSTLRAAFPKKADEIKPGMSFGADDLFERNARLAVAENTKLLTQTGSAQASLCTHAVVWFRKSAFWMIDDEGVRDKMIAAFPKGCRVEFSGKTYLKSVAESMDNAIVVAHAMPGRGQHRPGIGTSFLSVQDRINTFSNIEAETYEYGIPITYRASDTFAAEANEDQRAAPGLEVEVQLGPQQNIQQRIFQVRADSVSPDMAAHTKDLIGPYADMLTGTYPALTGAGEGSPETLGQQSMQRDQAMGRMGVHYVPLKQAHADVMTLACRLLEENSPGEVKVPILGASGDFESESVDITALAGEAKAYPEGDENFPELWNQQRATMMQIMDTPYGQKLTDEMANAELFGKMTGISELKIPGLDAWRKQLKEIGELTKIPAGDELLAGIAPMVEVAAYDFHDIEAKCCQWWENNQVGQKMKRQNPAGFQAVEEHRLQHLKMIPKPEPPAKPLAESMSIAFKDMPPEAQAQVLAKFGINVTPQDFMAAVALEQAKKKPAPGLAPAGAQAPPSGPANAAPSGAGAR